MDDLERGAKEYSTFAVSQLDTKRPKLLIMLDNGTFQHVWGRDIRKYLTNVRKCTPTPVKTAGGIIWLVEVGDLVLKDGILEQGFLNEHMDGSLLSTGRLSMFEGWKFMQDHRGHVIKDVWTGVEKVAWRQGVLHYLPQGMFADTNDNAISMVEPMEMSMMFDQYELPSHLTEVELADDLIPYTLTHPHRPFVHFNSPMLWGMKHQQMRRQNSHFSHMEKMYGVEDPLSDYWDAVEATLTSQGDKRITYLLRLLGKREFRLKVHDYGVNGDPIYGKGLRAFD